MIQNTIISQYWETNNVHNDDPPINYNKVVVIGLAIGPSCCQICQGKGFDAYGFIF